MLLRTKRICDDAVHDANPTFSFVMETKTVGLLTDTSGHVRQR